MTNPFAFVDMWQENIRLYDDFNVHRTVPKAVRLVTEEYHEVLLEANAPEINKLKLLLEAADLVMTIYGLVIAAGGSLDDMTDAMEIVNRKNRMKTKDTHYLNPQTGKITRLQKVPIEGGGGT